MVVAALLVLGACSGSDKPAVAPKPSACPSDSASPTSAVPPTTAPKNPIPAHVKAQTAPVIVRGSILSVLTAKGGDPATCKPAPVVSGTAFSGERLTIGRRGRPYLAMFVAHWCPHCRREVPKLSTWLRSSAAPKDIDVYTVATGTKPSEPNYPPSDWLRREHWPTQVLADSSKDAAAAAYGLPGYPYFVLVDGNGKVVSRFSGEVTVSSLQQALRTIS